MPRHRRPKGDQPAPGIARPVTDDDTEPMSLRFDDPTEPLESARPTWVPLAVLSGALALTAVLAIVLISGVGSSAPLSGAIRAATQAPTVVSTGSTTAAPSPTTASAAPPTTEPPATEQASSAAPPPVTDVPDQPTAEESSVYYKNCGQARAAGAAPIDAGEPGYRPELDPDHDSIACE